MRVFVTGATGFIGFAIVQDLIAAGHQVTGLTRSAASGQKLVAAGATPHIGTIEDLDSLRRAASAADGAIHTAFYHKLSHMPLRTRLRVLLGGAPSGIVQRFVEAAVAADRQTLETLAAALPGPASPLVAAFATLALPAGRLSTEADSYDPNFIGAPRAHTEHTLRDLAARGLRTSAIRLPPLVHGLGDRGGLAPQLLTLARKTKQSAFLGDGSNRWPAVHQQDAARLFRLALEHAPAGSTFHAVAEQGIPFRDLATHLANRLHVPVVEKLPSEAKHFGFLAPFVSRDNPTSSQLTQTELSWTPTHPTLLADLTNPAYFAA